MSRTARYGSDLIVDLLRAFDIEYVAANPGATFRGLHDSLVNYSPDGRPALIEVCHEEIGVAIAHGYAKARGQPMAVALHNVVGLTHASMAIFNAWCDRVPVLLLGGTGPVDAARRRPWIDWVHTGQLQADIVRPFVKWDDQPASHEAIVDSFVQGYRLCVAEPPGPVYLCYDALLQEEEVKATISIPAPRDFPVPSPPAPDPAALDRAVEILRSARQPVLLVEGLGRLAGAGALAEEIAGLLGAPVLEVTRSGSSVRNVFELDLTGCESDVLPQADVIVAVGVRDLEEALTRTDDTTRAVTALYRTGVPIIDIGLRALQQRGWLPESGRSLPVAVAVTSRPDLALAALRDRLRQAMGGEAARAESQRRAQPWLERRRQALDRWESEAVARAGERPIALAAVALALREALGKRPWVLANGTARGWARRLWRWERHDVFLGDSGGAGKGYGLGAAIGAALALKESGQLVINLQGDGDLLYTPSALWTAAHYRIPLLTVVLNNRSYYEDEDHQRRVAEFRGRPVERSRIGTRIEDPAVDFAGLARSMGVEGIGPVEAAEQLPEALSRAVRVVEEFRRPVLVDVVTQPR